MHRQDIEIDLVRQRDHRMLQIAVREAVDAERQVLGREPQVHAALGVDLDLHLAFGRVLHLRDGAAPHGIFDRPADGQRVADLGLAELGFIGAVDHFRGDKVVVELHQAFLGDDAGGQEG